MKERGLLGLALHLLCRCARLPLDRIEHAYVPHPDLQAFIARWPGAPPFQNALIRDCSLGNEQGLELRLSLNFATIMVINRNGRRVHKSAAFQVHGGNKELRQHRY